MQGIVYIMWVDEEQSFHMDIRYVYLYGYKAGLWVQVWTKGGVLCTFIWIEGGAWCRFIWI